MTIGLCLGAVDSATGAGHNEITSLERQFRELPLEARRLVGPLFWLHVLHRHKAGRDVFFVCNQIPQSEARQFTFRLLAQGEPECWDAMRNEITAPRCRRIDEGTIEMSLTLEPLETVLLVFQSKKIARPPRIEPDVTSLSGPIPLTRDPNPLVKPPQAYRRGQPLTLSPVGAADPFRGRATIPACADLNRCRVYLEMDDLPDHSAAVTVNGMKAGGLIGRPTRLEITPFLKPGENTVVIEPLAPKAARLTFYPATG